VDVFQLGAEERREIFRAIDEANKILEKVGLRITSGVTERASFDVPEDVEPVLYYCADDYVIFMYLEKIT